MEVGSAGGMEEYRFFISHTHLSLCQSKVMVASHGSGAKKDIYYMRCIGVLHFTGGANMKQKKVFLVMF